MKKHILIVDDQEAIRDLLRMTLGTVDYQLDEADSSELALQKITQLKPDLVLLDVMLPGSLDGYQLCERIKSDEDTRSIVVILLTARGQVMDIEKGKAVGADDYIVKPFSPAELKERIVSVCGW
ncbi:MAG: response regulator [Gammaproteobacteria bacterium]|jgi:DNA-binding response OmpR family regulator